jgi:hypothetical protein
MVDGACDFYFIFYIQLKKLIGELDMTAMNDKILSQKI